MSYTSYREKYEKLRARCVRSSNPTIEGGCTGAIHSWKPVCIINIVPEDTSRRVLDKQGSIWFSPELRIDDMNSSFDLDSKLNINNHDHEGGHYDSNDGFSTRIWGPMLWGFLSIMARHYPDRPTSHEKRSYKLFLEILGTVLPCKFCRTNYSSNTVSAGLNRNTFLSRELLSRYINNLHNTVNKCLDKHVYIDFETHRNMYEQIRIRPSTSTIPSAVICILPQDNTNKFKDTIWFSPRLCK